MTQLPYKAILFDLDGVLTDTHDHHFHSWQLWAKELNLEINQDFFVQTFGMRNNEIIQSFFPDKLTIEKITQLAERKEELFRQLAKNKISLFPGIEEMFLYLQQTQFPRIIASSTPRSNMEFFWEELNLKKYFNSYICGDDVRNGKPHPDPFLKAAEKLQQDPKHCVVFEDSFAGIEAAKKAQAYCVAIATTQKRAALEKHAQADFILNSPGDIQRWIKENLIS